MPNNIVCIEGMTCASCELLLERKLKAVPGVKHVDVHHKTGKAHITPDAANPPDYEHIARVIREAGYSLVEDGAPSVSSLALDRRKWLEMGAALVIIFALYNVLQIFDIVSIAPSTSGALTIGGVLLIGLIAGTSSCLAVTGGLLLAMAAKHNEVHQSATPWQRFRPLLQFNIGRLVSYFVLGGVVGMLGQTVTLGTKTTGYLNMIVALVMVYLALTILEIVPKGSFPLRPPKKFSRWITGLTESDHPVAPFMLGALTFFLPCGFTQSLQIAALASGNFATGAVIMGAFALGTLPSLIGISAISSTASGAFSRVFLRFSGTLVLVLALFNLQSGFVLAGFDVPQVFTSNTAIAPAIAVTKEGVQEVSMRVTSYGYEPRNITIKAGVPVRWNVDGTNAGGCASVLTIPDLNIVKPLARGENIIEFTAPSKGRLGFMCSMGMVRGEFNVI